ncbi:MAG: replicative DNA helicase [Candidatus Margulisiibacteriota bacterium]
MGMATEKIPPHNLEAEQSVLGSMMISKDAIALVVGFVKPDYFYRDAHRLIFEAIVSLFQKNEPVDLVTVSQTLKEMGKLTDIGGRSYLADVMNTVPTANNVQNYGHIVVETALLRQLIDAGSVIVSEAFDPTQEVDEVLESAQRRIMDVSRERVRDDFVKLKDVLMPVLDSIHAIYDNENKILGVPTGFHDLDELTSGFQKSDLLILAARPAMGKTALALNFAVNAAVQHQIPVAFFSLEMPKDQLALRLLCYQAKIDSSRLRTAQLHETEYRDITKAMGTLSEAPIYIDDAAGLSPLELRAKIRRLQLETDVRLVIIDYLQLMRSSKKRIENRFQEVSDIVREIKAFAKEAAVPVIALSQLSREVEKRNDKIPMLSDLRETGEIEQTADIVMFIHREDYYDSDRSTGRKDASATKLVVAKNRNGPTGDVQIVFRKDISRFYPATQANTPYAVHA